MKQGKNLIEFNCKNGVYSVGGTVEHLGYLSAVTIDRAISTTPIYGDGETQLTLVTDTGGTGTLEMTSKDTDFEKALGFIMEIAGGMAEIEVIKNTPISIGFESEFIDDSKTKKTKKVWLFGVTVAPASDSLSQSTDAVNNNAASYALTILGTNLKATGGTEDYKDSNGNTIKVWKQSSVPTDANYATFLDSVPTPTEKDSV